LQPLKFTTLEKKKSENEMLEQFSGQIHTWSDAALARP
jgi:hypothetical protein